MDALSSREPVQRFVESGAKHHTLGLVYGRRRIGKSTLLEDIARAYEGFYWEATRGDSAVHLERLGGALGAHLGVGRVALDNWEEALAQLLRLGKDQPLPVIIDEFGYLLEADPALDSVLAGALGPAARRAHGGRSRLILCGSAMALMGALTAGEAPLRGRCGLELVMHPFDYRAAARQWGLGEDLALATRLYAVIGGVIGYATDMVDHDLPANAGDFDRWVAQRVLSPAAPLHYEATTLLAEDPTLSAASASTLHSILGAIANGAVTAGTVANRLRPSVSNLDPALKRLIATGFVVRHEDPIRARRPRYALADPFLQFHYALLEPHGRLLRDRQAGTVWAHRLAASFDSRVRGPVFEEQARLWVRRYACDETLGGPPDYVGPSSIAIDGAEQQLDVVVAVGAGAPAARSVLAVGEAKAGERIDRGHLVRLERARAALGVQAAGARLLLFGADFSPELRSVAAGRSDTELVDLERLYRGT